MNDLNKSECIRIKRDTYVKVTQKGKSAVFENKSRASHRVIEVDGCAVTDGCRSDYLISIPSSGISLVIELKGSDVEHAFEQIAAKYHLAKKQLGGKVSALIVSSRSPSTSTTTQLVMQNFKKYLQSGETIKVFSGLTYRGTLKDHFVSSRDKVRIGRRAQR